jgi:hypothetical protein
MRQSARIDLGSLLLWIFLIDLKYIFIISLIAVTAPRIFLPFSEHYRLLRLGYPEY